MKDKKKQREQKNPDIIAMDDEALLKCAEWLRNCRGLDAYSGVTRGRRISYFKGDEFVDCVVSKKFTKKKFLPEPLRRVDAITLGNQLLKKQYCHHSEQMNKPKKMDDDAVQIIPHRTMNKMIDADEAVYTWILPESYTRLYIQSFLFFCTAIFLCMFKVWPLVLKIFVWWCALILLITMTTLFVIRLFFAAIFWICGFRGLWLLPDLFNEEIDTLETFTPLIGYGINSKKARKERRRKRKEKEEANKKLKGKKRIPKEEEEDKPTEIVVEGRFSDCNFGLINMLLILIIAIICCNHLGLFMSENIPDFVISQTELWKQFPGLAPPNATFNASTPIINETDQVEISKDEGIEDEEIDMSKFMDEIEDEDEILDDDDDNNNDNGDSGSRGDEL